MDSVYVMYLFGHDNHPVAEASAVDVCRLKLPSRCSALHNADHLKRSLAERDILCIRSLPGKQTINGWKCGLNADFVLAPSLEAVASEVRSVRPQVMTRRLVGQVIRHSHLPKHDAVMKVLIFLHSGRRANDRGS